MPTHKGCKWNFMHLASVFARSITTPSSPVPCLLLPLTSDTHSSSGIYQPATFPQHNRYQAASGTSILYQHCALLYITHVQQASDTNLSPFFSLQLYGLGVTCPLEARDRWPRVTSWQCVTSSHAQRARGPERSCLWCWARCVGSYAAWSYRRNTEVQRR